MNTTTGTTRGRANAGRADMDRPLAWPDDPETVTAEEIDFAALAHVLANTCRRGGCIRQYHSIAAHAVIVSEEIEALDGLAGEDRRRLALHALIADAPSAWLRGLLPDSQPGSLSGPGRAGKLAAAIEAAVREAASLDAAPDEEQAELLRFVKRMAAAAERRDLLEPGSGGAGPRTGEPSSAGIAFPPLKRRIRPVPPDKAATAWLARLRALAGPEDERRGAPGGELDGTDAAQA